MNVDLAERLITRVLSDERPERFAMYDWVVPAFDKFNRLDVCGTSCCAAGEAILIDRLDHGDTTRQALAYLLNLEGWRLKGESDRYDDVAARLLGIPPGTWGDYPLFYATRWPVHYANIAMSTRLAQAEEVCLAALVRDMIDGKVVYDPNCDDDWWAQFAGEAS